MNGSGRVTETSPRRRRLLGQRWQLFAAGEQSAQPRIEVRQLAQVADLPCRGDGVQRDVGQAETAVLDGVAELGEPRVERGGVLRLDQIVDLER
jgi:hypothetical protein